MFSSSAQKKGEVTPNGKEKTPRSTGPLGGGEKKRTGQEKVGREKGVRKRMYAAETTRKKRQYWRGYIGVKKYSERRLSTHKREEIFGRQETGTFKRHSCLGFLLRSVCDGDRKETEKNATSGTL